MKHNGLFRSILPLVRPPPLNKRDFIDGIIPPVKPKIKAVAFLAVKLITLRNHKTVRLHRAIDPGAKSPHHQTMFLGPGSLSLFQRLRSCETDQQLLPGKLDLSGLLKLAMLQAIANRLVIDLNIGQQGMLRNPLHRLAQLPQARLQCLLIHLRHLNPGWRNPANLRRKRRKGENKNEGGEMAKHDRLNTSAHLPLLQRLRRPYLGSFIEGSPFKYPSDVRKRSISITVLA